MRQKTRWAVVLAVAVLLASVGYALYLEWWNANYYVQEHIDYGVPANPVAQFLADDRLEDKQPAFDGALVDSRPLGDWQVNASAAVVKLDCPLMKPDYDAELLVLRASYSAALDAAKKQGLELLPSANLLDGAAKQFDDGLYAALDLAAFRGELNGVPGAVDFVQALLGKLPADSAARPFLATALGLAGRTVDLSAAERSATASLLADFDSDQAHSKPIGFYTWSDELHRCGGSTGFYRRNSTSRKSTCLAPWRTCSPRRPSCERSTRRSTPSTAGSPIRRAACRWRP